MPLTNEEKTFLDVFVFEATNGPPFGGPTTRNLHQCGIRYHDISWLLTAYQRELSAQGIPPIGHASATALASPWNSLEEAKARDEEMREELQRRELVSTSSGHKTPT
jgi:hypothetical protein